MKQPTFDYEDADDRRWIIVYEVEPYNPGGRDEPQSGGYATVTEIRHADGSTLPDDSWEMAGFGRNTLKRLEEACFEKACDEEESRREAAIDAKIDADRDRDEMRRAD